MPETRQGRARGLLTQRCVVAVQRKRQFFSLSQLNEAIWELVAKLNQKPFRKLPGTRADLHEKLDRPALASPAAPALRVFHSGRRSASEWTTRGGGRPTLSTPNHSSSASNSRLVTLLPPWRFFTAGSAWPRIRSVAMFGDIPPNRRIARRLTSATWNGITPDCWKGLAPSASSRCASRRPSHQSSSSGSQLSRRHGAASPGSSMRRGAIAISRICVPVGRRLAGLPLVARLPKELVPADQRRQVDGAARGRADRRNNGGLARESAEPMGKVGVLSQTNLVEKRFAAVNERVIPPSRRKRRNFRFPGC
jgi:hypothetical protein